MSREYVNTGGPATIRLRDYTRELCQGDRLRFGSDMTLEKIAIIVQDWPDLVPVDSDRGRRFMALEAAEEAAALAAEEQDRARAVAWLEANPLPDYVYWYLRHG